MEGEVLPVLRDGVGEGYAHLLVDFGELVEVVLEEGDLLSLSDTTQVLLLLVLLRPTLRLNNNNKNNNINTCS